MFWFMLAFFAIPQMRWVVINYRDDYFSGPSMSWEAIQFLIYCIYYSLISIMVILSAFADKEPRHTTYPKFANPSPELRVGAVIKLFYFWFDRTAWRGYQRPLVETDIYDINPENASAELVPKFDRNFQRSVKKSQKKKEKENSKDKSGSREEEVVGEGSVLFALTRTFGGPFLFALGLRFLIDFLQFGSPVILGALISYVDTEETGALWKGLVLTFGLFLISFVMAVLNGNQSVIAYRVGFCMRTALISSIYRKALKISSAAKRGTTVGEIVNLMAVDAHRFFEMIPYLMLTLTALPVMALATYLLYNILGVSTFAGVIVLVALFPISGFVANQLKNLQYIQMKLKDERVKLTNEILNGIKVLKLYAWEPSFETQISNIRAKEIAMLRKAAMYNAFTEFIWGLAPFLVSFASFATYVYLGNNLTPTTAFVSLALFNILRMPMMFCKSLILILILELNLI